MADEELKKRFEAAQKITIQAPEAQPLTGDVKPFDTQFVNTSGSALSQPPKEYDMNATPSPYEGAKAYLQRLIDTAGSRQAETVRDENLARAQEAVLGIGDMGRAIANMIATKHYAPNGFQDSGLSDKARARAEKAKAERDKHRDELLNYHMAMGKLGENERNWKFQREMAKANQELAKAERERAAAEAEEKRAEQKRHNEAMESIAKQRADIAQQNANTNEKKAASKAQEALIKARQGISGYSKTTTYEYNETTGKPTKVTVVRTPNGEEYRIKESSGGSGGKGGGSLLPNKPQQGKPAGSLLPNKKQ